MTTSTAVVSWLGPRHSRDENRVGAAAAAFRSILGGHHCSLRELQLHLKARRVDLWVALASTRKSGCERAASGCAPKGDDGPPHVPHRTLHFYRRLELQARSSTYCSLLNFSGLSPAARIRLNGWLRVCRDCVLLRRRQPKLSRLQYPDIKAMKMKAAIAGAPSRSAVLLKWGRSTLAFFPMRNTHSGV